MAGRQAKTITPVQMDALIQHVRGRRDTPRSTFSNPMAIVTSPTKARMVTGPRSVRHRRCWRVSTFII